MSDSGQAGIRAVVFGTPDGGLWGAAVESGALALVAGDRSRGEAASAGVSWSQDDDGAWRLEGEGTELSVTAASAPAPADAVAAGGDASAAGEDRSLPDGGAGAAPELCRVRGRLAVAGAHAFDAVGVRVTLAPASGSRRAAKDTPSSLRLVAAWFPDGTAVGLVAARPRRAGHHDGERVAAAVFDSDAWIAVTDPRLSTTYDADGRPRRMNLELWIGDGEREYPRRAAGEVSSPGPATAAGDLALSVTPLTCHGRGPTGAGVYALARL